MSTEPESTPALRDRVQELVLVLLVLAAFSSALGGGFVWDDDRYVTHNPLLTEEDGFFRIWFSRDHPSQYFPLVYSSFWVERRLFGLDPFGYHLNNILLHATNALLLLFLLRRMGLAGAWIGAVLFAVHPVQVESVAWITERKNLLSLLLSLLSLHAFWSSLSGGTWSRRAYGASILLFVLALLAKTTACTLPAALVILCWIRRRRLESRMWVAVAPYVLLGLAMGLFTVWWEHDKQGLHPDAGLLTLLDRVLLACRAVFFYLEKIVWPFSLSFSYPRFTIDATSPVQWIPPAALFLLVVAGILFRKRIPGEVGAALLFFVATLSPLLGLISLYTFYYTFVADHYQYMACIGPLALAGGLLARLIARRARAGATLAFLWIACLAVLTFHQCRIYATPEALWSDTLDKNPASWLAHTNLGTLRQAEGRIAEATHHFREARRLNPDAYRTWFNLGSALQLGGDLDEAVRCFREALRLRPEAPDVHGNLGLALHARGQTEEGLGHLRRAVELAPEQAEFRLNLGTALRLSGRLEAARRQHEEAVRLAPRLVAARAALAQTLAAAGKGDEAARIAGEAATLAEKAGDRDQALRLRELAASYAKKVRVEGE
jgi:tetratricopeptide (TPR) repeat protein